MPNRPWPRPQPLSTRASKLADAQATADTATKRIAALEHRVERLEAAIDEVRGVPHIVEK